MDDDVTTGRNSVDVTIVGGLHHQGLPQAQSDALFAGVARAILAKLP